MVSELEKLVGVPRLLMSVDLEPVQSHRFQPTGFADLGAAVYERPDGVRMILVESAQSVANRLEHVCLDGEGPRLSEDMAGLPYILVKLVGDVETETSSLIEAHRINSPFIINNSEFQANFKEETGYAKGKPIDWSKVGNVIFRYDPNSLLHGVFLANFEDGRIKMPRALSGFIEAENIREAASGGVKNNLLDPSGKIRVEGFDKDVYGNVPYHRMEYTADKITAYFNLDLSLLDGYKLEPDARRLLVALGLLKIRRFLEGGLRLRTACNFKIKGDIMVDAPEGFFLPSGEFLLEEVKRCIKECTKKDLFAKPPTTKLMTKVKEKKEKKKKGSGDEAVGEEDS